MSGAGGICILELHVWCSLSGFEEYQKTKILNALAHLFLERDIYRQSIFTEEKITPTYWQMDL